MLPVLILEGRSWADSLAVCERMNLDFPECAFAQVDPE